MHLTCTNLSEEKIKEALNEVSPMARDELIEGIRARRDWPGEAIHMGNHRGLMLRPCF